LIRTRAHERGKDAPLKKRQAIQGVGRAKNLQRPAPKKKSTSARRVMGPHPGRSEFEPLKSVVASNDYRRDQRFFRWGQRDGGRVGWGQDRGRAKDSGPTPYKRGGSPNPGAPKAYLLNATSCRGPFRRLQKAHQRRLQRVGQNRATAHHRKAQSHGGGGRDTRRKRRENSRGAILAPAKCPTKQRTGRGGRRKVSGPCSAAHPGTGVLDVKPRFITAGRSKNEHAPLLRRRWLGKTDCWPRGANSNAGARERAGGGPELERKRPLTGKGVRRGVTTLASYARLSAKRASSLKEHPAARQPPRRGDRDRGRGKPARRPDGEILGDGGRGREPFTGTNRGRTSQAKMPGARRKRSRTQVARGNKTRGFQKSQGPVRVGETLGTPTASREEQAAVGFGVLVLKDAGTASQARKGDVPSRRGLGPGRGRNVGVDVSRWEKKNSPQATGRCRNAGTRGPTRRHRNAEKTASRGKGTGRQRAEHAPQGRGLKPKRARAARENRRQTQRVEGGREAHNTYQTRTAGSTKASTAAQAPARDVGAAPKGTTHDFVVGGGHGMPREYRRTRGTERVLGADGGVSSRVAR